jgi:glycosyltransferase involved in cell wall biosynthesis
VAYSDADLEPFRDGGTVLLYVGRYTSVKRIPLLIRAHARARERFERRAPLAILGGFPGEWEDEHPLSVVRETGDPDVFLAGWRGHEDLPEGLNAADLLVLPSVHEQFGAVLVEAMACGLPVIAVNAHGPAEIVDDGDTGWLVPPDDEDAMVEALVDAVNVDAERRRRGERAHEVARSRYAWPALAGGLARVYDEVLEGRPAEAGAQTLLEAE